MNYKTLLSDNNKYLTLFLIFIFIFICTIFIFKAFINATTLNGSVDLFPIHHLSKNFWNRIDIFEGMKPGETGMPVWNHLIYIIFYPLTIFSFDTAKILWFFLNLIFTYVIVRILKKAYNLGINKSLILAIIIISSTPFTNTLGNGQIGLFLLMTLLIYWYSNNKFKGIFLSTAYIKFSFAPFFLINSLFKKEVDVIYAMIISTLAVIFFGLYISDLKLIEFFNPLLAIISVIKVNSETFVGDGNNFHIRALFLNLGLFNYYVYGMVFFGILNLINIFYFKRKSDVLFLLISISSLFIFYHNYYDLVFLIPLAGYLLKKNVSKFIFLINFPIILWFFYFVRFNELLLNNYIPQNFINITGSILIIISYLSLTFQNMKNKK